MRGFNSGVFYFSVFLLSQNVLYLQNGAITVRNEILVFSRRMKIIYITFLTIVFPDNLWGRMERFNQSDLAILHDLLLYHVQFKNYSFDLHLWGAFKMDNKIRKNSFKHYVILKFIEFTD